MSIEYNSNVNLHADKISIDGNRVTNSNANTMAHVKSCN